MTTSVSRFTSRRCAPVMRDLSLAHQIDFVQSTDINGLGVRVTCNCGALAPTNHVDLDHAWRLYDDHLAGKW